MMCTQCGHATRVVETRAEFDGLVNRRRRECQACSHRFSTLEIDDALGATIRKHLGPHAKAVRKRQDLNRRDSEIANRLRAGEKHAALAAEYGLSDSMVSTIARRMGIPAYAQQRRVL